MAKSLFQESVKLVGLPGATAGTRFVGATTSGYPTSGSFLVGDFAVDQTGGMWICTASGSPGTWARGGFPINENVAGKNFVINGNMDIWQRGVGPFYTASGTNYSADQWSYTQGSTGGTGTMNLVTSQSTNVPAASSAKYSLSVTITGAYSGTLQEVASRQRYEAQHVRPLQGSPVTVSFWYYSNVSGSHGVRIGFDTSNSGTYTNSSAYTFNYPTINTWQYVTQTFTSLIGFSMGTENDNAFAAFLDIGPRVGGATTYGQITVTSGNSWSLAQVQMEIGNTATPFSRAAGTFQQELALCQRYYWQQGGTQTYEPYGNGFGVSSIDFTCKIQPPVIMRIIPTMSFLNVRIVQSNTTTIIAPAATSGTINVTNSSPYMFGTDFFATGLYQGYPGWISANNTTNSYIAFSAEI